VILDVIGDVHRAAMSMIQPSVETATTGRARGGGYGRHLMASLAR
jgi:hypothetical protein